MDSFIQAYENNVRGGMKITGEMFNLFGSVMKVNPFALPYSKAVKRYGSYLKAKSMPISQRSWRTKNRIVRRGPKNVLREFTSDKKGAPLLLVPPEAGHNSQIVDFGPRQSLVRSAMDHAKGNVYVLEKLPAGPQHADYSIDDGIRSLDQCIQHIGKPVHLIGLCQGGWQSAVYAALFPERVKTLTLAGAPIDFHAGDGLISQWAKTLPLSFYKSMVALGWGVMPGSFITAGFKMMNAVDRFVGDDVNLYKNIDDPKYVERYRRFNQWYEFNQPLGGRMYLEVVEHLFKKNKLVNGRLEIMDRKVDLANIDQPLNLIAGIKDDITPPPQLFAIEDHVSSRRVEKTTANAGHIGVFMQEQVINEIWSKLFQRLS
jgi:poly(3-hydroxybutyrate) depolymerase